MELPYVLGDWDLKGGVWPAVFFLAGAKSADPGLAERDREVSELMMKLWTNFAETGNPSLKGVVDWSAWDEAKDQYLYVSESLEVRSGFSKVGQK